MGLLQPEEIELIDSVGNPHKFIIGKIPYLSGGRAVVSEYLPTGSKSDLYARNEELAKIMLSHVEVVKDTGNIPLSTPDLINNHLTDMQLAMKLEEAVFQYQINFYPTGGIFGHLGDLGRLIAALASKTETP